MYCHFHDQLEQAEIAQRRFTSFKSKKMIFGIAKDVRSATGVITSLCKQHAQRRDKVHAMMST
jgi:hypothetical protein